MNMKLLTLSYNLSRPYPFKWFLPAVVVGGLFASVFISLLNYALNGFYLSNRYSSDYNGTVSQHDWTQQGLFSALAKVKTSCQASSLAVNAQFYTDKLSFPYTINAIWQQKENSTEPMPQVPYANNILEDCVVNNILMDLESSQRTAEQQGWTDWGVKATALISCSVTNPLGKTVLNLSTSYEYITSTGVLGNPYSFLHRDPQNKTSLWWGESLLSWWWLDLVETTANHTVDPSSNGTRQLVQGSLNFQPTAVSDISSREFLQFGGYHLLVSDGVFVGYGNAKISENIRDRNYPNMWGPADTFAKVLYSTVLADLGSSAGANILTDPALLQNLSDFEHMPTVTNQWITFGPANKSYDQLKSSTGPLGITNSTIYAQYLCQVVDRKPAGTLFVAILVADLVILQALWTITKWVTTAWVEHRNPRANYCEGCLAKYDRVGDEDKLAENEGSSERLELAALPKVRARPFSRQDASSESQQPLVRMESRTGSESGAIRL